MPQEQLETDLQTLKLRRKQIVSDLNDTDTKIIGLKLELERRNESKRAALQEERDLERECHAFDD